MLLEATHPVMLIVHVKVMPREEMHHALMKLHVMVMSHEEMHQALNREGTNHDYMLQNTCHEKILREENLHGGNLIEILGNFLASPVLIVEKCLNVDDLLELPWQWIHKKEVHLSMENE